MEPDWWAIGAGLVGAALGAAATLLAVVPQLRRQRREAAADYQNALADSLFEMATAFEANKIPHKAGHTCEVLLEHYEKYLQPYLKEETAKTVLRLRQLYSEAKQRDGELANLLFKEDDLRKLAKELRGAAGDLSGQAHQLRLGGYDVSSLSTKTDGNLPTRQLSGDSGRRRITKIDPSRGFWRFSRMATTIVAMFWGASELGRLGNLLPTAPHAPRERFLELGVGILGAGLGYLVYRLSERPRRVEVQER